jgi:hypothetical protein
MSARWKEQNGLGWLLEGVGDQGWSRVSIPLAATKGVL